MSIGEKIKIALSYRGMTMQELAYKMGYNSSSALYNKFKRDDFSESDLKKFCDLLQCEYDIVIRLKESGKEI